MKKKVISITATSGLFISIVFLILSQYASADQAVFKEKCSRCHLLKNPDDYTKEKWKYNVGRMAERAGLTPPEIKSIIELNTR